MDDELFRSVNELISSKKGEEIARRKALNIPVIAKDPNGYYKIEAIRLANGEVAYKNMGSMHGKWAEDTFEDYVLIECTDSLAEYFDKVKECIN